MNVGLGDDTITSSFNFSTERDKEDEACKLWNNIRGIRTPKHNVVEDAITGFSHAMLCCFMMVGLKWLKRINK